MASGILELYAMEALSPAESREVEALAAQYPEIRQEIDNIQQAMNSYALLHTETPRSELKQEILEKVQAKPKTIAATPGSGRNWFGMVGAILGLAGIILAILCFTRSKKIENNLEQVVAEREALQDNYNRLVANFEFINQDSTKIVPLASQIQGAPYEVTIYWNEQEKVALLAIKNLPRPPAGKQYQLWSLKTGSAPIPAGLIEFEALDFQTMPNITQAEGFAITLENEGGSETPTLPIYVLGTI